MQTTESDLHEDVPADEENDEKIDQIVDRERELKTAKQEARRSEAATDDATTENSFSKRISTVRENLKTPATGRIKKIEPVDENKIELVVDVDGTESTQKLSVPQSGDAYKTDPKLVRLLDYVGAEKTDISALRGEQVPVRKDRNSQYKIVAPKNCNTTALRVFSLWQTMIRYRLVEKQRHYGGYTQKYQLSPRGFATVTPITTTVGLGGSDYLFTVANSLGSLLGTGVGVVALTLGGIGVLSGFILGYTAIGWLGLKSIRAAVGIGEKLKKYSPF